MKYLKDFDNIVRKIVKTKYQYCYICGEYLPENQRTVGHVFSRRNLITRWDLNFIRMECFKCNCLFDQNNKKFKAKLAEEIGKYNWQAMKNYSTLTVKNKTEFQIKTAECLLNECENLELTCQANRLRKIIKELKGEKNEILERLR